MKKAILLRDKSTDQGTLGHLFFGGTECRTIELPWRDNRPRRSCIPDGNYTCKIVNSPKFGRVYEVKNVPGRSHVLFHSANLAGDVDLGFDTQLHGCIAPCKFSGVMRNSKGVMQTAGLASRPAFRDFMSWAGGSDFNLEVIWA